MKKSLLVLLIMIILSGCSVTRIDNYNYDDLINKIISLNIKMTNKVGNGYNYYAPKGVVRVDADTYNDVLKKNNITYYLYVDVVSYYYKTDFDYKINEKAYYSFIFNSKKKKGYVEVKENKNKLFVKMTYNYAKIETYVDKRNLKEALSDMSYILSSVKFNDSLLNKMYESGNLSSKEEVYKLFDNKEKEGNFIEYMKEFDKYDGNEDNSLEVEEEIKVENKTTTAKPTTKSETEVSTTTSNEQ